MLSAAFIPRSETSSSGHPVKHLDADGEASFSINCFEPLLSISTWPGSAAGLWLTNRHSSRQPARRGCMCSQTLHIPPLPTYLNINSIIIIITAQKLPPFFKLWHQAQGVDQLNRASVRWSVAVSSSFNRRPPPFQTRLPWRAAACQNAIKNWNPFLHPFCFQRWRPRSECKPKGTHMMFRCHHAGIPGLTDERRSEIGGNLKRLPVFRVSISEPQTGNTHRSGIDRSIRGGTHPTHMQRNLPGGWEWSSSGGHKHEWEEGNRDLR